jgi:hypothetical protein
MIFQTLLRFISRRDQAQALGNGYKPAPLPEYPGHKKRCPGQLLLLAKVNKLTGEIQEHNHLFRFIYLRSTL